MSRSRNGICIRCCSRTRREAAVSGPVGTITGLTTASKRSYSSGSTSGICRSAARNLSVLARSARCFKYNSPANCPDGVADRNCSTGTPSKAASSSAFFSRSSGRDMVRFMARILLSSRTGPVSLPRYRTFRLPENGGRYSHDEIASGDKGKSKHEFVVRVRELGPQSKTNRMMPTHLAQHIHDVIDNLARYSKLTRLTPSHSFVFKREGDGNVHLPASVAGRFQQTI